MSSLTLIRWGGLAAVVAGLLFIIVTLINLLNLIIEQGPSVLLVSTTQLGGALLLFGLVGLYFRWSEAIGIAGLIGFVFAFFGAALALGGSVWANLVSVLGWALLGIACLQARVYPGVAAMLLLIGTLLTAIFFSAVMLGGAPVGILAYMGIVATIIFYMAVVWLGFSLFTGSSEEALEQTPHAR